ncbi:GNAT family N-acetyltransferase [Temperatibacter marinus]|uniref:GNAT family N-acetyltransferase n=1 Tax=Temperatibacter marinus TaxID=1456591 RepID=A0AA52HBU4_9PROT|nr:GNAT family N-acetyltransferase [Temperatibacter marinus]WND04115.1 GNAT family N-acetyltransferase [Temperatibacter marinus]
MPLITLRSATPNDREFILSLSPILAEPIKLAWHSDAAIKMFQQAYILEMLECEKSESHTVIAEIDTQPVGFIHACKSKDEVSGEACGTIPLLAVKKEAQHSGVGKALMQEAESWARKKDYRLLHLEVFSSNTEGRGFYKALGYGEDTINLIKELS